jgi:MOSC domain-containing protein YiiM
MEIERCDECRFDATDYTRGDLVGTLRAVGPMWREMVAGIDDALLSTRPAPGVWSALEYAAHSRDVTMAMGVLLHVALTEPDTVLPAPPAEPSVPELPPTLSDAVAQLDANAARVLRKVSRLSDEEWSHRVTVGAEARDVAWIVGHAVHDATHHLRDVGRGLHTLGAGAPRQEGTVVQVSASGGGVPKVAIASATIDRRGVVGDHQADRKHHGRPLQALCLWSADVIAELQREGHPISAGAAGENITVTGIDWTTIRSGIRLAIGDALVEVSGYATPCAKNARWFRDREFARIDHANHPGSSRAYAWVLEGGTVEPGAPVIVEP